MSEHQFTVEASRGGASFTFLIYSVGSLIQCKDITNTLASLYNSG